MKDKGTKDFFNILKLTNQKFNQKQKELKHDCLICGSFLYSANRAYIGGSKSILNRTNYCKDCFNKLACKPSA